MCFCITLNIKGDLSSEEISPMTTFKLVASPQNKLRILTLFFFFHAEVYLLPKNS